MESLWRRLGTTLKDVFFPIFCLLCKKEGAILCNFCQKYIDTNGFFACPICHIQSPSGRCCLTCAPSSFLSSHISVGIYEEKNIFGRLIQEMKYNFVEDTWKVFDSLLHKFVSFHRPLFVQYDYFVPVPLHRKRLAERGFNQSEILSMLLSRFLQKESVCALKRRNRTEQQAKLNKEERVKNVKDAFVIAPSFNSGGKRILLIDDVFTTGSTLQECARVLREDGAREVGSFTLARG